MQHAYPQVLYLDCIIPNNDGQAKISTTARIRVKKGAVKKVPEKKKTLPSEKKLGGVFLFCPYAERCKKADKNRTVCLNQELTAIHKEVLNNLNSIHGALLRMNRSIQAEGTFGILKYDRWYKRVVRRGLDSVKLELFLVSIGHNLYKFFNKHYRLRKAV